MHGGNPKLIKITLFAVQSIITIHLAFVFVLYT